MVFKRISTAVIATAMVVAPLESHAGDALVGGIIGGIIGGAIVNESNKNRRKAAPRKAAPRSTVSSAQREANREVQVALNYFGFPVGTPDGALGAKSRAAISQYQAHLGFAPSGNLNAWEQELLVQSFYRAQAGGMTTAQQAAADPRGTKGLLIGYRDEKLGVGAVPGGQMAAVAPVVPQLGFVAAGAAVVGAGVPQLGAVVEAVAPAATALPSFLGQGATQVSLASHCNKVSLVTNSNGGFVTQATMKDPAFALSEQFCLARTYAIAQGEEMVSKITGFTPQQISQQCAGFGPVMQEHVAALSLKSREEVVQGVSGFVVGSGMAPAQLAGTAKICLGAGYVTDDMNVAIGSALILTTLGEAPYAELVGHHLAAGIGATQRMDLALPWFEQSFGTSGSGTAVQVFAPGMADRPALIKAAAYSAAGRPLPGQAVPVAPVPAATLPTFGAPVPAPANP